MSLTKGTVYFFDTFIYWVRIKYNPVPRFHPLHFTAKPALPAWRCLDVFCGGAAPCPASSKEQKWKALLGKLGNLFSARNCYRSFFEKILMDIPCEIPQTTMLANINTIFLMVAETDDNSEKSMLIFAKY